MKLYLEETKSWLSGKTLKEIAKQHKVSGPSISDRCYRTIRKLEDYYQLSTHLDHDKQMQFTNNPKGKAAYWLKVIDDYEKGKPQPIHFELSYQPFEERLIASLTVKEFSELMDSLMRKAVNEATYTVKM